MPKPRTSGGQDPRREGVPGARHNRNQPEPRRKDDDHEDRHDEARHGDAHGCDEQAEIVGERVLFEGRNDAYRDADDHSECQRNQPESYRVAEATVPEGFVVRRAEQDVLYVRPRGAVGRAEVAANRAADELPLLVDVADGVRHKLAPQRLIQPVIGLSASASTHPPGVDRSCVSHGPPGALRMMIKVTSATANRVGIIQSKRRTMKVVIRHLSKLFFYRKEKGEPTNRLSP